MADQLTINLQPLIEKLDNLQSEVERLRDQIEDRLPTPERNWKIREAAERIGISYDACRQRIARGQIKVIDVDGYTLIPDSEVRRLIQRGGKP